VSNPSLNGRKKVKIEEKDKELKMEEKDKELKMEARKRDKAKALRRSGRSRKSNIIEWAPARSYGLTF
jgi:hypothetical protein